MLIKEIQPHISLTEFVSKYQIIRWQYDTNYMPPNKFLAPRPEHSLTFYIRDLQSYSFVGSSKKESYPKSIVSGIHTETLIRDCGYNFWALKIIFHPCALFRLTGISMKQLVSNFADAEAIFGKEANLLYARLNSTDNVNEMVTLVEIYLQKVISKKIKDFHPLDTVSKQMLTKDGIQDLDNLSKQSFLSTRQFIRKFEERTGISPKMFCKIVRFDKAYRFKNNNPNWDWLSIALECGYYDYQHLTKDYLEFTNHTPFAYYEIDKKAPERDFGLHFG